MKYNVFYKYQFGFRQNYSTKLALLDSIDEIMSALNGKEYVAAIFFDVAKAFDCVCVCVCVCVCMYVCVCARVWVCESVRVWVYVCECLCVSVWVFVCVCDKCLVIVLSRVDQA